MARLPTGWRFEKIGNLCEVGRGPSPRPINNTAYFEGGTIPWIKIADATKSGKYLYETKEHVNEFGASFSRLLPKGSLILAASGTLGYTQILGIDGCIHDGWLYLTNFKDVEKDFLYYLFLYQKQFFYNSAYGAAIQNINTMILRDMEIALPPLPSQRKIAEVLSAYDDLIENNSRRINILEHLAQSVYLEWCGKVDDKSLPRGWEATKLKDIAEVNSSSIKKGNEPDEIYYIDIASVSTGSIDKVELLKFSDAPGRARRIVKHGDIIWSSVRPNRKSYSLIINPISNLIVSTGFAVIRAVSVPFSYLYLTTTTEDFVSYLTSHATGAAYPAVTGSVFEDAVVVLPTKELLQKFDEIVNPLLIMQQTLFTQNANLRRTRDLLLPRLVSGEVDVSGIQFADPEL